MGSEIPSYIASHIATCISLENVGGQNVCEKKYGTLKLILDQL